MLRREDLIRQIDLPNFSGNASRDLQRLGIESAMASSPSKIASLLANISPPTEAPAVQDLGMNPFPA